MPTRGATSRKKTGGLVARETCVLGALILSSVAPKWSKAPSGPPLISGLSVRLAQRLTVRALVRSDALWADLWRISLNVVVGRRCVYGKSSIEPVSGSGKLLPVRSRSASVDLIVRCR